MQRGKCRSCPSKTTHRERTREMDQFNNPVTYEAAFVCIKCARTVWTRDADGVLVR